MIVIGGEEDLYERLCYRTTPGEGLGRADKRLDKISAVLCGLRPRYMALDLVARILSIFITIIISPDCDK